MTQSKGKTKQPIKGQEHWNQNLEMDLFLFFSFFAFAFSFAFAYEMIKK